MPFSLLESYNISEEPSSPSSCYFPPWRWL